VLAFDVGASRLTDPASRSNVTGDLCNRVGQGGRATLNGSGSHGGGTSRGGGALASRLGATRPRRHEVLELREY
jgi:hypothetical protein